MTILDQVHEAIRNFPGIEVTLNAKGITVSMSFGKAKGGWIDPAPSFAASITHGWDARPEDLIESIHRAQVAWNAINQ